MKKIAFIIVYLGLFGCAVSPTLPQQGMLEKRVSSFLPENGMSEKQVSDLSEYSCGKLVFKGSYNEYQNVKVYQTEKFSSSGITENGCGGNLYFINGKFIRSTELEDGIGFLERSKLIKQKDRFVNANFPPVVSPNEIVILKNNGFMLGKWSENCNDANAYYAVYHVDGNRFFGDFYSKQKWLRRGYYYDVYDQGGGKLKFKAFSVGIANATSVSEIVTTFEGTRRVPVDVVSYSINTNLVSKGVPQIKNSSEVYYDKNGKVSSVKPVTPVYYCK